MTGLSIIIYRSKVIRCKIKVCRTTHTARDSKSKQSRKIKSKTTCEIRTCGSALLDFTSDHFTTMYYDILAFYSD